MQFQPGGSLLATGSSDKYIHLWEVPANGHAYPHGFLQGSHGAINTLDFDTEGVSRSFDLIFGTEEKQTSNFI